ncbi:unnamed protein product, partial [Rotaria magnacalcarata]
NGPSTKILKDLLRYLWGKLKDRLEIRSFHSKSKARPRISNCRFVIAGGDVKESVAIHNAFSLLNLSNFDTSVITGDNNDGVAFPLKELLNRVTILNCIYKGSNGE